MNMGSVNQTLGIFKGKGNIIYAILSYLIYIIGHDHAEIDYIRTTKGILTELIKVENEQFDINTLVQNCSNCIGNALVLL